ncbi:MAG TPA: ABC transporter permease [Gemmatimonadaceae bacterium]|nr:ABC transporter permease [Gemmatimonadaceae bacterium]
MDFLRHDVRHAARLLRRNPALTLIAGVALTLGIGLTTTIFSFVYGVILRGLPFEEPQEIMHLARTHPARGVRKMDVSIHDFRDWRAQQRAFGDLAAFYTTTVNVSGTEKPERFSGGFMTANAFDVLRVRPHLGRTFREGEDRPGAEPVIVLGYSVWRDRYGADPGIVGRTIRANGEPVTVIGVMPEKFAFPFSQQLWLPLRLDPLALPRGEGQMVQVFGRLRPGVPLDEASAQMDAIARRLQLEHPATNEGIGTTVGPFVRQVLLDQGVELLYTMLGAVLLVLLVACANVANLLLSRAAARGKEVAIRTALGASRVRVAVQFLVEALALACVGGVLGTGLAWAGVRLLGDALKRDGVPFFVDIRLDGVALLFVLATTLAATLVAGLLPALQASRADVGDVLKDETRGSSSFRIGRISKAIVVLEIALSCGLLVGAGLTIKSVTKLRHVDFGFETRSVLTARVGLPEGKYPGGASQLRFYEELQARLAALPGVDAVSLGSALPAAATLRRDRLALDGRAYAAERDYPLTGVGVAAPGYFAAFGVEPRRGRDFSTGDRAGALPVAIVNESFARRFFQDRDPVGRRIRTGGPETKEPWRTIVGVAPDLYASGPNNREPDGIYVPMAQAPQRFLSIALRTRGDPLALSATVRQVVTDIDSDLPIYNVKSLAGAIDGETWFYDVFGAVFMVFGFVALFLAAVGLYGVMAFSVGRRTREIGIRSALGAQGRDVLGLILRQGLAQIGLGLLLGVSLAAALSHFMAMLLFQVEPRDPAVFAAVIVTLFLTGVAACLIPARRAARVDPMVALRIE